MRNGLMLESRYLAVHRSISVEPYQIIPKIWLISKYFWHARHRGDPMENHSYFYQAVTKVAEDRIKELMHHAKEAEVKDHVFTEAGSYFRACAQTVYFAWRDITAGWHTKGDVERLELMIDLPLWPELCRTE
jgi:hypothetical protein